MREEFLTFMKSHPFFEDFVEEVLKHRPDFPAHNPKDDNTEVWKSASAMQAGFDLCLMYFGIGEHNE